MTVDDVDSIETVEAEITQIHITESDRLWTDYLSARKQEFILSSIETIGSEYHDNTRYWDTQFEREWSIIHERLSSGLGVTDDIVQHLGDNYFQTDEELAAEAKEIREELQTEIIGGGQCVTVYTWEDFSALHRQGIFTEYEFILAPGRGWKKNMLKEIREVWGYASIGQFPLNGERHIILQKITGGGGFVEN